MDTKSTVEEVKNFNQRVSGFFGTKATREIERFYKRNGVVNKGQLFIAGASWDLETEKAERGESSRDFQGDLTLGDVMNFMGALYDIPRPGGFDVVHCFAVTNTPEFNGILYSDLTSRVTPLTTGSGDFEKIMSHLYGNINMDVTASSASLFFLAEMTNFIDKYQHLAYDYAMIMGGGIVQNGYIKAQKMEIKKCALGCYSKERALELFVNGNDSYICMTNLIIG